MWFIELQNKRTLFQAERYIVNGCHDQRKLQDMLDGFIKKFVLCEKCDNPETVIKVKKNLVGASCRACGHAYVMDMRHKLTTFIVKVIHLRILIAGSFTS